MKSMRKLAILFGAAFFFVGCQEKSMTEVETVHPAEAHVPFTAVCYHPVSIGDTLRSFDYLAEDIALMKEAGIDIIRVYEPIDDDSIMDFIAAQDMKVIVGIGYNQRGKNDLISGTYLEYVVKYKDHPAVFMWELGNEYNYHPEWFEGDIQNWYQVLEQAVDAIHELDSLTPVSTTHGEIPDSAALYAGRHLDMWGFNVYRWDRPATFIEDWRKLSDQPFYFGEVGADSYMKIAKDGFEAGENQKAQAQAVSNIIDDILNYRDEVAGIAIFSFTDGWWKAGSPDTQDIGGYAPNSSGVPYDGAPNEEFWGIVDINRNKKASFDVVKAKFNALKS